jgi:hypothetical protein
VVNLNKKILGKKAYFAIGWSEKHRYNRILASRVLPELPGIIIFFMVKNSRVKPFFSFATWRDGLREGVRNLFDSHFSKFKTMLEYVDDPHMYYSFTVVDSNKRDLRDIFYWVIKNYRPELNSLESFTHTGRYDEIIVYESTIKNPMEHVTLPGMHN